MVHQSLVFQFPYAIPFWITFWLVFGSEGRVVRTALDQSAADQDQGTFRLLMVGTPIALAVALVVSAVPSFLIDYPSIAFVSGILLMLGGLMLRLASKKALASSFTGRVVVVADQAVVQTGGLPIDTTSVVHRGFYDAGGRGRGVGKLDQRGGDVSRVLFSVWSAGARRRGGLIGDPRQSLS